MSPREPLEEGWYLMNTRELERELRRRRDPAASEPASSAVRLSIEDALAYRNDGNLPDGEGRTLRLVLHVSGTGDRKNLDRKRLLYEPDFHDAPKWRRKGSKAVNVVPLDVGGEEGAPLPEAWWDDPELVRLEEEWAESGRVAGLRVPAAYRGFVYKTVLALGRAGRPITPDSVADSIARWLPQDEVARIRAALR